MSKVICIPKRFSFSPILGQPISSIPFPTITLCSEGLQYDVFDAKFMELIMTYYSKKNNLWMDNPVLASADGSGWVTWPKLLANSTPFRLAAALNVRFKIMGRVSHFEIDKTVFTMKQVWSLRPHARSSLFLVS